MPHIPFDQAVEKLTSQDPRYSGEAYYFVRDALDHTVKSLRRSPLKSRAQHHVSGQELLEGIRQYAVEQYGPMAKVVLESWGITICEDFGEIVFNLVSSGVFGLTETDTKDDFKAIYSFEDAFVKPFLPKVSLSPSGSDAIPRKPVRTIPKRNAKPGAATPKQHEA